MKIYQSIILLLLVGCQLTENNEVVHYESNCPPMTASEKGTMNDTSVPTFRKDPKYPISAARAGIGGYVRMEFDISKEGNPININVIESYPSDTFVDAATESLSYWKYTPVVDHGEVILSKCHSVQLDFVLA